MKVASAAGAPRRRKRRTLILVFDGLCPGSVRPDLTPNLARLALHGVTFTRSRTGFPSQTMVGAGELFSGSYPERSGVTSNDLIVPGGPVEGLDLKNAQAMRTVKRAYGDVMPQTSLFEALAGAGLTSAVIGKEGPPELGYAAGATWAVSPDAGQSRKGPSSVALARMVRAAAGQAPGKQSPDAGRSRWIGEGAAAINRRLRPDTMVIWFTDPDATQHETGIGSRASRAALRQADRAAGKLLAELRRRGDLANMNVVVTSDHGFSSFEQHAGVDAKRLREVLSCAGLQVSHVVPTGNLHVVRFAKAPDAATLARARAAIAASEFAPLVRTVLENLPTSGAATSGRMSGAHLRQGTQRAGHLYVVYRHTPGMEGGPGTSVGADAKGRAAGHGGMVWSDLNNTLLLAGADVERGARTANAVGIVDIAPTVLGWHGLTAPRGMQGRVLAEAARDGKPGVPALRARRRSAVADAQLGSRLITTRLLTEWIGRHSYFVGLATSEQPVD